MIIGYKMTPSQKCIDLVKSFEGFRDKSYQDQAGVWTIGYGTTLGVKSGDTCIEAQADKWLAAALKKAGECVDKNVGRDLKQNEYDSLCSFVYNLGCQAFKTSTLCKLVSLNDAKAPGEFLRWANVRIGGVLTPSVGLMRRRKAEIAMYQGQTFPIGNS